MKISERIKNMDNYGMEKERTEREEIEKKKREESEMINKIKHLKPRIQDLLSVANACLANGIELEHGSWNHNYDKGDFIADATTHKLGFIKNASSPICYIGITGGGWSLYDLKTNGVELDADGRDKFIALKRFLKDFDKFEKLFYAYVDDMTVDYSDEVKKKSQEWKSRKNAYIEEHSIHKRASNFIGCPKCGSKLNRDHINGEKCPLCGTDLRSKSTIDKIKWYNKKIKECSEKYRQKVFKA